MTNKLSPTTVYVPVSAKDELPVVVNKTKFSSESFFILDNRYKDNCLDKKVSFYNGGDTGQSLFNRIRNDISWLKEQQLYTFTREELEKLLYDVFSAGEKRQHEYDTNQNLGNPAMFEYIQSLF